MARSAVPSSQRNWYQKPKDEDIIGEAYADYIRGPFNIKAGKQIVVWGETDIKRTVDVVNGRSSIRGFVEWKHEVAKRPTKTAINNDLMVAIQELM